MFIRRLIVLSLLPPFSSLLAGDLVYREGLDYVNGLPKDQIFAVVQRYTSSKQRASGLVAALQSGDALSPEDKDYLIDLISAGGARSGIELQ